MLRLPARFAAVMLCFAPLFFQRAWRQAEVLLLGTILAPGARTVIGPERVPMEDWLQAIFGPSLPETPMGRGAISAVTGHMNAVRQGLRLDGGRHWRPLYLREEDGTVIAQPWAAGFMFAVKRWSGVWRPIFETGHHITLMLPIIALEAEEDVERLTAGRPDARAHLAQAHHHVPEAVLAIRNYWHALRTRSV